MLNSYSEAFKWIYENPQEYEKVKKELNQIEEEERKGIKRKTF